MVLVSSTPKLSGLVLPCLDRCLEEEEGAGGRGWREAACGSGGRESREWGAVGADSGVSVGHIYQRNRILEIWEADTRVT